MGHKQYELSKHLGKVLAVVSDRIRMKTDSTWTQVLSRTDYYPFGLEMTGKTERNTYRYGFNGKEKDPSGQWSNQSHYDYGFRIYNPTIGKFLSVDPLAKEFPWNSSYAFAENDVIRNVDLDGLEKVETRFTFTPGKPKVQLINSDITIVNANAPREEVFKIQLANRIYTANSYKTLEGRDNGVDEVGDFSGISTLQKEDLISAFGYASYIINDVYNGNVEQATAYNQMRLEGLEKSWILKVKCTI
ncbi:RHS repeat domain-containing protein [Algoriphagus sp. A40]|uniref:RHS repeat domain-containing protein n=1 Tax=Algoriphagus sp. A40 TaxID=1945863 RepID=UPI0009844C50|nr:RHS repeat-associated core domain-containing protein [Algoriphagus sp. A40]OOG76498.1 hypothetical protein B0E43_08405 [Algoriphagus sp. A40]